MSMSSDSLFESALALPQSDRADLAFRLLRTVDATGKEFGLSNMIDDVRRITQELFPGEGDFTHEFDPEYPDDRYVVVNVEAQGEPKELADRRRAWHERIRQRYPNITRELRLLILPV